MALIQKSGLVIKMLMSSYEKQHMDLG